MSMHFTFVAVPSLPGTWQKQIDDFNEAIAICPEDKRSYYRRGWVKLLQQKEPEANLDFIQGMRRDPAIAQPFYRQQFLEICHSNP